MSQAEPKLKQKRRPRRNHARTIAELAMFCEVSVSALAYLNGGEQPNEGIDAQIRAYTQIAKMLEGNGK